MSEQWQSFTPELARNMVDVRSTSGVHYYNCLFARGVFTELRTGNRVHIEDVEAIRESFICR